MKLNNILYESSMFDDDNEFANTDSFHINVSMTLYPSPYSIRLSRLFEGYNNISVKSFTKELYNYFKKINHILELSPIIEKYEMYMKTPDNKEIDAVDGESLYNLQMDWFNKLGVTKDTDTYNPAYYYIYVPFIMNITFYKPIELNKYYHLFVKFITELLYAKFPEYRRDPKIEACGLSINGISYAKMQEIDVMYEKIFKKYIITDNVKGDGIVPVLEYTGPVKLSDISQKKIEDFELGDILYVTRKKQLVSQQYTDNKLNYPIALYVSDGYFASMRYASDEYPDTGDDSVEFLYPSGKMKNKEGEVFDISETNDPVTEIQRIYKKANEIMIKENHKEYNWFRNGHIDSDTLSFKYGMFPGLCALYRFHTYGTKRGNWLLPNVDLIKLIFDNRDIFEKQYETACMMSDFYSASYFMNSDYYAPYCTCLVIQNKFKEPYFAGYKNDDIKVEMPGLSSYIFKPFLYVENP